MPLGKVAPSAVAWKERVICRNTMVLNRPWSGQLIDRVYYLLYFKSLSGSCPESRGVFHGDCPLGWVCRACQQSSGTNQTSWSRRNSYHPPLGRGQAPLGSGRRAVSLAPAHSHWLAWHQRTSVAQVQAVCLPRQMCWFRLQQGGSCFQGNILLMAV